MAGIKGIKFGKSTTLTKYKGDVIIINTGITIDELEECLDRKMSEMFNRHKVEPKKEIKRTTYKIEGLSDKEHLMKLIINLAIKEDHEGLTEEEKRLAEIYSKLWLLMN